MRYSVESPNHSLSTLNLFDIYSATLLNKCLSIVKFSESANALMAVKWIHVVEFVPFLYLMIDTYSTRSSISSTSICWLDTYRKRKKKKEISYSSFAKEKRGGSRCHRTIEPKSANVTAEEILRKYYQF